MKEIIRSMLDQLKLLSEVVNDMVTNVESLMQYEVGKESPKVCECCEKEEDLVLTTNLKKLCRNCYEEYGSMFN